MQYSTEVLKIGAEQVKQVNKCEARKLFNNNERIFLLPVNNHAKNTYWLPLEINKELETFDSLVNSFYYFNESNEYHYIQFFVVL